MLAPDVATLPPPNDLDRLASAWAAFRDLVNTHLPAYTGRLLAVRSKVNTTAPPPAPKPF